MEDVCKVIALMSDDVERVVWKHVCKETSTVEGISRDRVCTEIAKSSNLNLLSWAREEGYQWNSEITSSYICDKWLNSEMSPLSATIGERVELIEWSLQL